MFKLWRSVDPLRPNPPSNYRDQLWVDINRLWRSRDSIYKRFEKEQQERVRLKKEVNALKHELRIIKRWVMVDKVSKSITQ